MQIFETDRLTIRTWQQEDFDALHAMLSDPITMGHWPEPLDAQASQAWLDRSQQGMEEFGLGRWCCQLRHSGEIIGDVGIVRMALEGQSINDLGYIIHHPFWHQGFGFEAASGAVRWAKEHARLDAVAANMAVDNTPSVGVARKLGMRLVKTFNKANNQNKPTHWFELDLQAS